MKYLVLLLFIPFISVAQKKVPAKTAKPKQIKVIGVPKPRKDYIINGNVKGYKDGTVVTLLNPQTNIPDMNAIVMNGKFTIKGKMDKPDFRVIMFDNKPPYLSLFLDNSIVEINGNSNAIANAGVLGSLSHMEFQNFSTLMEPYMNVFDETKSYDSARAERAAALCRLFVLQRPGSYVSPLALLRFNQITEDVSETEKLYNSLKAEVKNTALSNYIQSLVQEAKKNPVGSTLPNFVQKDTAGNELSLASLKGKYVLVDFWASWCRPCRQENPNIVKAFEKYKDRNFTVLGVSLDQNAENWKNAIQQDSLTWQHVSDLKGWANEVALQFEIYNIPQNFLLDPEGKIIAKNIRGAALERKLRHFLIR
jgi:peroxiredoxin